VKAQDHDQIVAYSRDDNLHPPFHQSPNDVGLLAFIRLPVGRHLDDGLVTGPHNRRTSLITEFVGSARTRGTCVMVVESADLVGGHEYERRFFGVCT
jgi:hypothetical protein